MAGNEIIINLDLDDDCNGGSPPQYPTPEQVFEMWDTYFEPLLKFSDNYTPSVLETFEQDPLNYVKTIV